VRGGDVADHRARRAGRHLGRAAQQHPDPVAALGQLVQEVLPDETRGAGQGNQGCAHRETSSPG
jgi:hypothetical protein